MLFNVALGWGTTSRVLNVFLIFSFLNANRYHLSYDCVQMIHHPRTVGLFGVSHAQDRFTHHHCLC